MKLVKALVTEVLLASIAVFSVASSVQAQAMVTIDMIVCGMLDGNGVFVVTADTHHVTTNNTPVAGEAKFTCQATVTPSLSGRAVIWDFENTGLSCFVPPSYVTTSWHEVVSAKGEATLQCHINPGNP